MSSIWQVPMFSICSSIRRRDSWFPHYYITPPKTSNSQHQISKWLGCSKFGEQHASTSTFAQTPCSGFWIFLSLLKYIYLTSLYEVISQKNLLFYEGWLPLPTFPHKLSRRNHIFLEFGNWPAGHDQLFPVPDQLISILCNHFAKQIIF